MEIGPTEAASRLLDMRPDRVRLLSRSVNDHWAIGAASGTFVLRRFGVTQTRASIEWETHVVEHLADRGWPVPTALAGPALIGGRVWVMLRRLPGRRMTATPRTHFERGRLLGRLHRELDGLTVGQREGWSRTDLAANSIYDVLDDLPDTLATRFPEHAGVLAERMRAFVAHTLESLDTQRVRDLPASVIHGDLLPWNLLVGRDGVTGVLDFEKSRWDFRATDVAFATWGGTIRVRSDRRLPRRNLRLLHDLRPQGSVVSDMPVRTATAPPLAT